MGKRPLKEMLEDKHPRIGFDGLLYFEICGRACAIINQKRQELQKLKDSKPKNGKLRMYGVEELGILDDIRKNECVAITFAAMCLEACIWDYAACNTSQKYTKNYLEKLDFVAKWVVIPKLISGSDITAVRINGTCLLDILQRLKKARNKLVHSKSRPSPKTLSEIRKSLNPKRDINPQEAFGPIGLLLRELEKVDKTKWWLFEKAAYRHFMGKLRSLETGEIIPEP
jgi:hypothetical protein